ncbi:MAG: hypothetical protein CM15mP106_2880 [Candidatus Neomarinimicrobiota bacterium]|nr:MAG: hypothetical protein CM15mP106_2880 [Candidatus Neomarinimicrobiota bacterium]
MMLKNFVQVNYIQIQFFSFVAGSDIIVHSYELSEDFLAPGSEIEIEITVQNRGLLTLW